MTQVLSTSSFYSHNWTNVQFDKRRSDWFEIRQSESLSRKRASVFTSLVYGRDSTQLKQRSNGTNPCMYATKTPSNKNNKEESTHKTSNLTKTTDFTPSVKDTSQNTPPSSLGITDISVNLSESLPLVSSIQQPNEKVSKISNTPSASQKLEITLKDVSVPPWSVEVYTGRYVIEGTEDLSDNVFHARHERLELTEKKRKRRDERCLEEREKLNRLKQLNQSTNKPNQTVKYIELVDKAPRCAFGRVIPDLKPQYFSLPSHFFVLARHETLNLSRNHRTNNSKTKK